METRQYAACSTGFEHESESLRGIASVRKPGEEFNPLLVAIDVRRLCPELIDRHKKAAQSR
jgi:hypothetical protein